ncbi:hypothetical protein BU24DRAFT_417006 [Aaosphaeria arxii CBS 175.79]|uniref:Uncharacterized protein n=1 Tax=Aaosphaeria arxii CBS 175.79 TaxID=1450172 RepID=A0A6A5Y948_9PLEO|nr:uncharacterized protein BU24DRAFT_417006 [Aaosphaeria arxii CBS 175.79]KAF2021340.1 hypothetical protein BU24DRAFT_417006 [Aaosphaeria arxii CBS 175.79]
MAYPAVFEDTRRYYEAPEFYLGDCVSVIFLFKTHRQQRHQIVKKLLDGDDKPWPEGVEKKRLEVMPWLRNYTPNSNIVFKLLNEYNGSARVFIDEEGAEKGNCIIGHLVKVKIGAGYGNDTFEPEFARVELKKTLYLISSNEARQYQSYFPGFLDEGCKLEDSGVDGADKLLQEESIHTQNEWKWPTHIPGDLRLQIEKPVIISLIHLTDAELKEIQSDVGTDDVDIINWPSDIDPATQTDTWHIFDRIKPDFPGENTKVHGFFIDSDNFAGPRREPELLLLTLELGEAWCRGLKGGDGVNTFTMENFLRGHAIEKNLFTDAWRATFVTPELEKENQMRGLNLHGMFSPVSVNIGNPHVPAVISELPVFVLQKITAVQERMLRDDCRHDWDEQIVHVPRGDGTFRSLMRWFQTAEFMRYNEKPPRDFIAIDKITVAGLDERAAKSGDPTTTEERPLNILLATCANVWYTGDDENGPQLGLDEVGYRVGRVLNEDCCSWQEWTGHCSQAMGLNSFIEEYEEQLDQTGTGNFYWNCFDEDDEELDELVTLME